MLLLLLVLTLSSLFHENFGFQFLMDLHVFGHFEYYLTTYGMMSDYVFTPPFFFPSKACKILCTYVISIH